MRGAAPSWCSISWCRWPRHSLSTGRMRRRSTFVRADRASDVPGPGGAGIEAVGGKRRAVALALVVGTCVAALFNYYRDPARQKEDVRAAVPRRRAPRPSARRVHFAPTVFQIVAPYQTMGAPLHYVTIRRPRLWTASWRDFYAGCSSFWYLRARPWVDDPDGRCCGHPIPLPGRRRS